MFSALILTAICALTRAEMQKTPIPDNTPIIFNKLANAYISYENYAMLYYVDLTDYYNLRNVIESTIELENAACNELPPNDMCKITLEQLRIRAKHLSINDEDLGAQRKPRGLCNWCGLLQSKLYGTLDIYQGQKLVDHINANTNETKILQNTLLNNTVLFQTFLKTDEKQLQQIEDALNLLHKELDQTQNKLKNEINKLNIRAQEQNLFQITSSALAEHTHMHAQIRRALADARSHQIPELISSDSLKNDLKKLTTLLKSNQRLPIDMNTDNPLHILKFTEVTSMIVKNKLLIEIVLPIAEREQYTLYRASPIPIETPYGRLIIQTSITYFLLNTDQTKFIQLSNTEIDDGKMLTPNEFIYKPSSATHLNYENICVWRILIENNLDEALPICKFLPFPRSDTIITIIENEKYFFASKNGTNFWEICDQNETRHDLIGRNIITLDPDCFVKTATHILKPHKTHIFNQTQLITPIIAASKISKSKLETLAKQSFQHLNFTKFNPIVIHDPNEMKDFIDETNQLVNSAQHKFNLEQLSLAS